MTDDAIHSNVEAAVTLNAVANDAPDAVIVSDAQGHILMANPQAERMFGYAAGELLGQSVESLVPQAWRAGHPPLREKFLQQPASHLLGTRVQLTACRKDGSEFPTSISLNLIDTPEGPRAISAIRETTGSSATRAELEEANRHLAAANAEHESFAYSVSHDLRAPLRAVKGFSQIVLKRYGDALDDEGRDFLRRVSDAAQRMDHMINALLDLSRISRDELQRAPVDLSALAGAILHDLGSAEPERQVDIRIEPGLTADADAALLRVALDNLLGNAWKYTGKTREARIECGRAQADGESVFFIRDNGAGFDMEHAEDLFGVFRRLHHASDFPGHGIGLATVQRVISKHGGRIWAESVPDQGATFRFTLGNPGIQGGGHD